MTIFFGGLIIWRERDHMSNEFYDTLPLPDWLVSIGADGASNTATAHMFPLRTQKERGALCSTPFDPSLGVAYFLKHQASTRREAATDGGAKISIGKCVLELAAHLCHRLLFLN